ncbi:hypothetical protein AB0869_18280 [Micromonospora vinacea]|uniref:hypothetical protein n=1 Tax=Micromonospora vinacea TaxID=709878 RepID=UPI0034553624
MAFRTWGRLLLTALGVSVLAGAGQLGVAYGFGIVRLTGAFTGTTVNQWPAQLVWVGWFAANAAVAGAVLTGRLARRDAPAASTGRQLAVGGAAALGATVIAPLCMQPARAAELISVDPVWAVGICAMVGAVIGAGAAIAVLFRPELGWNVAVVAGAVWLLALISVLPSLGTAGPLPTVRLGVLEPSWLDAATAQRLAPLLLPTVALLAGAATAGLARWRGQAPLVSGATGLAGPVLVAFAYLTAGPGDAVDRYQATPYYGSLIAILAGALGAAAAALLRWPTGTRSADPQAIQPTSILRPLPAGPALPGAANDRDTAERTDTETTNAELATAQPGGVVAGPWAAGDGVRTVPAHWDWPETTVSGQHGPAPAASTPAASAPAASTRAASTQPAAWLTAPTGEFSSAGQTPPARLDDVPATTEPSATADVGDVTATSATAGRVDAATPTGGRAADEPTSGASTDTTGGTATSATGGTATGSTASGSTATGSTATGPSGRPTAGHTTRTSAATAVPSSTDASGTGTTSSAAPGAPTGSARPIPSGSATRTGAAAPGTGSDTAATSASPTGTGAPSPVTAATGPTPTDTGTTSTGTTSTGTTGTGSADHGTPEAPPTIKPRRTRKSKATPDATASDVAGVTSPVGSATTHGTTTDETDTRETSTGRAPKGTRPGGFADGTSSEAAIDTPVPSQGNQGGRSSSTAEVTSTAAAGTTAARATATGAKRAPATPVTGAKRPPAASTTAGTGATQVPANPEPPTTATDATSTPTTEAGTGTGTGTGAGTETGVTPASASPTTATGHTGAGATASPRVPKAGTGGKAAATSPTSESAITGAEGTDSARPATGGVPTAGLFGATAAGDPDAGRWTPAPSGWPVTSAWTVPPQSSEPEATASEGQSRPDEPTGPTPTPRPRHRAPLPDLSRAGTWNAFDTSRRGGSTGSPDSSTARTAPTEAGETTPAGHPGPLEFPATEGSTSATTTDSATDTGDVAPTDAASATPPKVAEQSSRRGRLGGLFRRNRSRADEESPKTSDEAEPLASQDEEFVDWVAGLSKPVSDNEPEQENGRRSLRSSGRHHRE